MDNRSRTEPGQITLRVGVQEGDLQGSDDRVIQAAVDYVARLGGGRVEVLEGTYLMRHGLVLRSGVTLAGRGAETVLRKCPSTRQPLVRDADWYEAAVEVADASDYRPGSAIMLRSYVDGEDGRLLSVVRETVTGVDGGVISLSGRIRSNMWLQDRACAATLFPLITAEEETHDVRIEGLILDGNQDENEEINGNYAGGVFIQRCDRWSFHEVTSRNYNGDGFSFQVCDDIHFTSCTAEDNANLGFHPGSGSQRPVFRDCVSVRNNQGIFFCWGVTHGTVERCVCSDNRHYGISIGHRDTDNRIADCRIERNHRVGILFREQEAFRGGHRNIIESCSIVDNGFERDGVGVDVTGETFDVTLKENVLSDSGRKQQRIGVRIGEKAARITTEKNQYIGMDEDVVHLSRETEVVK